MNTVYVLVGYNDYDITVVLGVYGTWHTLMDGYKDVLEKGLVFDNYGYTVNVVGKTNLTGTKVVKFFNWDCDFYDDDVCKVF